MSSNSRWRVVFVALAVALFGGAFVVGAQSAEAVGSLPGTLILGTATSVPYAGDLDGDGWDDMITVDEAGGYLNVNFASSLKRFNSTGLFPEFYLFNQTLPGSNRSYFFTPLIDLLSSGVIDTAKAGTLKYKSDMGIIYWDSAVSRVKFRWRDTVSAAWSLDDAVFPPTVTTSNFKTAIMDLDGDGRGDPLVYFSTQGAVYALLSSTQYDSGLGSYFYRYPAITDADMVVPVDVDNLATDPNDKSRSWYPRGRDFLDDIGFVKFGTSGYIKVLRSVYGTASDWTGLSYRNYNTGPGILTLTDPANGKPAPAAGSYVFGTDWDGDGVKDIVWAEPSGTTYTWRGYLSATDGNADGLGYEYVSDLLGHTWGTYQASGIQERLAVGHFDSSDFKAEPAAVNNAPNGQGGGTRGSWYVDFSSNLTNGLTNANSWQLPYLASWRYGLAIGNWDDAAKTCYSFPSGTPVPGATPVLATPVACAFSHTGQNQGFEIPGLSENAALKYQPEANKPWLTMNRMAPNLNYSNTLDPRANIIYSGNYFRTNVYFSRNDGYTAPSYTLGAPGSVLADWDGRSRDQYAPAPSPTPRCVLGDYPGATPAPCTDASAPFRKIKPSFWSDRGTNTLLFDRPTMYKWLMANRRGPMNDARRWYMVKPTDESLSWEMYHEKDQVLIYRDWTRLVKQVRDDILAQYGRRVWPSIMMGGPGLDPGNIQPANIDGHIQYDATRGYATPGPSYRVADGYSKSTTEADVWNAYLTRVLRQLTKASTDDISGDAGASGLENWTTADAAAFSEFYRYNAMTFFPGMTGIRKYVASGASSPTPWPTYTPGPGPTSTALPVAEPKGMMDFDPPGGSTLAYNVPSSSYRTSVIDPWISNVATVMDTVAVGQRNVQGCWNGTAWAACNKPTFITQIAGHSYGSPASGWNSYGACPDCPATGDDVSYDVGRYGVMYGNAYVMGRLLKEMEGKSNVWAWLYWVTVDEPLYKDTFNGDMWGSLNNPVDPLVDWQWSSTASNATPVVATPVPGGNSGGITPMGYSYLWGAASGGNVATPMPTAVPFTYWGNAGKSDMKSAGCTSADPWCWDRHSFTAVGPTPTPMSKPPWLP